MARVCFTLACESASNGAPAPYYAVPSVDTPSGARCRGKDGDLIPHMLPPEVLSNPVPAKGATHAVYTFDGRTVARELTNGRVWRLSDQEVSYLRDKYPALVERLPDEELNEDTIGALLDEKKAAELKAEQASKEAAVAEKTADSIAAKLAKETAEKNNLLAENARLQEQLRKMGQKQPAKSEDKTKGA